MDTAAITPMRFIVSDHCGQLVQCLCMDGILPLASRRRQSAGVFPS